MEELRLNFNKKNHNECAAVKIENFLEFEDFISYEQSLLEIMEDESKDEKTRNRARNFFLEDMKYFMQNVEAIA